MNRIPLKSIPVDGSVLDYREQIKIIMRAPSEPSRGLTIDEIRSSIRVLDALDKAEGDFCDLEDTDFNFMVGKVNAARFAQAHSAILQFVDDVTAKAEGT